MTVFTLEHIGHTVIQTLPLLFNILSAQMYLILQHGVFKWQTPHCQFLLCVIKFS